MANQLPPSNPYLAPNPYAPPESQVVGLPNIPTSIPLTTALYSPGHVALATFLGTPLAGAAVLALNEERLGRRNAALVTILLGAIGTAVILGIAFVLPDNIPASPFNLLQFVTLVIIARHRQGELVKRHYAAGGKKASAWSALGISLLTTVIAVIFAIPVFLVFALATGSQD